MNEICTKSVEKQKNRCLTEEICYVNISELLRDLTENTKSKRNLKELEKSS